MHNMKVMGTLLGKYNIRTNTISPGTYPSQMTAGGVIDVRNASSWEGRVSPVDQIPMQRPGKAKDMAGAILWLAGEGGGYTNGCVLVTDGGRLSVLPGSH